jgi:hypothetical protein
MGVAQALVIHLDLARLMRGYDRATDSQAWQDSPAVEPLGFMLDLDIPREVVGCL